MASNQSRSGRLLQRAAVAALRRLDHAVAVDIALGQELGDQLQAVDPPLATPIAAGLDVIPGGDERPALASRKLP